jgi:hypothetical protein
VEDGLWVDVVDGGQEAIFKLLFGSDQDMTQRGARELGEEAINQVEPAPLILGPRRDPSAGS